MLNKVARLCREEGLILPGDTVTVAVSGGADSMALLWCLYLLQEKLHFSLKAAHFHHGLRPESDEEAEFVRTFCDSYGIALALGKGQITRQGRGMEDAARTARYAFLWQAAGSGKLATAHTLNDNAETLLIRLTRGTSLRGLGGIRPRSGALIRPLLNTNRQEVEAFLQEWSIPHVEDSSNASGAYLRNRVRRELLPKLIEENPAFLENTRELSHVFQAEDALLSQLAAAALEKARVGEGLSVTAVQRQHEALQRRILASFLVENGISEPQNFQIRQALALLYSQKPGGQVTFTGGLTLRRVYDRLEAAQEAPEPTLLPIFGEGDAFYGNDWAVSWKKVMNSGPFENNPFTFHLRCGIMTLQGLCLRPRQSGDTLTLPGGSKALNRLMMDRKIPRHLRGQIPVLSWEGGVIAAASIGCDPQWLAQSGEAAVAFSFTKR